MLTYADITDLVKTVERLQILATVDDLTKVLNRRQFLASFETEPKKAINHDRPLSVMMIDADDFKCINDQHGHSAMKCSAPSFARPTWWAASTARNSRPLLPGPISPMQSGPPSDCVGKSRTGRSMSGRLEFA